MEQLHPHAIPVQEPRDEGASPDTSRVEDLLRALSAAVRSYRLYGGDGPSLERFVTALRRRFADLWEVLPQLVLQVEEQRFRWEGEVVFPSGGESGELAFQFYKDGVRELTFLPGFEDEVPAFLEIVSQAPQLREDEDDLTTILWERDLDFLRYEVVEVSVEPVELHGGGGSPPSVDPAAVREAAAEPAPAGTISEDDFEETLYFLDESELRKLAEEVRKEDERDLWADVMAALFDRLEDADPARQERIVNGIAELLPAALAAGRLDRAAALLGELAGLAARPGLLGPPVLRKIRGLFEELARPETLEQLVQTLEDAPEALQSRDLGLLLGFFPPSALVSLVRASEAAARPDVRRTLESAAERLARSNSAVVIGLLAHEDPVVVAGAARWVGRLEIGAGASDLTRLLGSPDVSVRLAAVQALQWLRASSAGGRVMELLEDGDREVRVAAARALAALGYTAARPALEAIIQSKRLRAADRTEKIAVFEAYGQLSGADGVAMLERTLSARGWLGRTESAEIRACAALALGRVKHPSARTALQAASNDTDPVVRSAVSRALRGEGG